ncbi:MAG: hypothetical protein QNK89_02890 [Lacinutrix sp.]|uniref:hypothetical protein n=1 Tax=Lacinutrix sp. TaxID=1937692 RepID=UPI0030A0EB2B
MVKLTKEEIQFIDNYLDNSEVIYADIRLEITDHIASEIEAIMETDKTAIFYDVFKSYMVENKANLLNENKKFVNAVTNQNWKLILKELINFKTIKHVFFIPMFLMIPIAIVYLICTKMYDFSRFSGVERLGFIFTILFNIFHFISIITQPRIEEFSTVISRIIA